MMQPPVYAREDDSIIDAFHKMRESDLRGLPIVDADMRVIGYIDLLELVLTCIHIEQGKGAEA